MSNRVIEAVVRLSAKLGSLAAFSQLSAKMAAVNKQAAAYNRTQAAMASSSRIAMAAAARYLAPAALAYAAAAAGKEFATLERRMTRIGINANASSEAMQGAMGRVRTIADDLHAPVENVLSGLESLIASGKSLDEALALLPTVSAAAQAADADFKEMASTSDAISSAFEIAADRMSGAFDIIAHGGKMGKFELKDMASELPSLAPAFAALGYRGEEGLKRLTAALQIVRMEVGTSGEAATSFMDVISKMETDTVSNNFKKFGVNIRKEMGRARASGEDTLGAFIRLSREAVDGDMSKLPQLFTDKQMLVGMRALMNRFPELLGMYDELGNAAGTVMRDNERLARDTQATFDDMANSWDRLKKSIGEGVAPAVTPVLDSVSDGINDLINRDKENDIIKAYAEEKKLSASERLRLLMPGYFPGLGDKKQDEERRAGILWEKGVRTEADRKRIAGYQQGARRYSDTPERDPSLGPEVRTLPEIGPVPRFRDDAERDGSTGGTAKVPVPKPRPSEVDIAIDRADEARILKLMAGVYRDYRHSSVPVIPLPPSYAPQTYPPQAPPLRALDQVKAGISSVNFPPTKHLDRFVEDVSSGSNPRIERLKSLFSNFSGVSSRDGDLKRRGEELPASTARGDGTGRPAMSNVADMLRALEDASSAVGSDLARGGEDAASALTNAAPSVGASIGDAAAAKIAADAAMAGTAFGNAAAARIREAAGSIKIQAVAAPRSGGVSGNPGKAMPGAGEAVATP